MKNIIFVSYYTFNTPYEEEVKKLIASLKKWNLPYDIQGVKSLGSWRANTVYKAKFVKEMLLKHKIPIVFIDADATIEEYPLLFDILDIYYKYDIALHYLDWDLWLGRNQGIKSALSGTLYLDYNAKVLGFLDSWIKKNKENESKWEQANMEAVLANWKDRLKVYVLPAEYCCLMTKDDQVPRYVTKPVILHRQVSRKYKLFISS